MALVAGIIVGLLLALPPAGSLVVGLNLSMTMGFRRARPYAYGIACGDLAYAFLAALSVQAVAGFHARLVRDFPSLTFTLHMFVVAALLGYGIYLFLRRNPLTLRSSEAGSPAGGAVSRFLPAAPIFLGIGLQLSNAFSPTFLGALAVLTTRVQALGTITGGPTDCVLYAIGYALGNTLYLQSAMWLVARHTGSMRGGLLLRIQKISGATLAAIGGMLLFIILQSWLT